METKRSLWEIVRKNKKEKENNANQRKSAEIYGSANRSNPVKLNSIQFNSIQFNPIQFNSIQLN